MAPPVVQTAAVAEAAGGGDAQPQQQQQQRGFGSTVSGIIRIAVFWYFASKFFSPKQKPMDPSQSHHLMTNLFHKGESLDMWFYLSEQEKFSDFSNEGALYWHETNIPYAVWTPESIRTKSLKYYPSETLQNNGSLYAHVFFARSGFPIDPSDPEYQPLNSFSRTHPVATYFPKRKANKKKSLLGNAKESDESQPEVEIVVDKNSKVKEEVPVEWVSLWKPNVTINLVDDFTHYSQNGVPPNIAPRILLFLLFTDLLVEPSSGNYYPTIYFNEFWLLRDKMIPMNETVSEVPLELEISPISMMKWQLFQQVDQSFQMQRSYGSMLDGESDELKRVFLEGNPYLLGITMFVSMLHSVFDFLAFKNDIQFWNKNKSMEGLSAKSVVLNFICQFVIFLYLLDNDTSWMILASSGVGVCIEFWKIGKAMRIEVDRSGMIPRLRFHDRESYASNKTKEYDDIAIKFLSYVLLLLVVGFINYKLKSVAHLPWRQMTYKFLNTIIDDLFAFVIKMPILHRLSVFRDDVIFLIYLYQRWVYPVDKTRVNEFGFGGEDETAEKKLITEKEEEDNKKTN
ncbi:hypothetical protein Bca101_014538 [Brassica carinata]